MSATFVIAILMIIIPAIVFVRRLIGSYDDMVFFIKEVVLPFLLFCSFVLGLIMLEQAPIYGQEKRQEEGLQIAPPTQAQGLGMALTPSQPPSTP